MSSSSAQVFSKFKQSPPAIAWRVWPIRDEPRRAWLLTAMVPAVAVATLWTTGRWYLAAAATCLTAVALWRTWVPVSFELQPKGLTQTVGRRTRLIHWKDVRRYEVRPAGIVLFGAAEAAPWDLLRGLYLPCGERRDEVLTVLSFYLKGPGAGDDRSSQLRRPSA